MEELDLSIGGKVMPKDYVESKWVGGKLNPGASAWLEYVKKHRKPGEKYSEALQRLGKTYKKGKGKKKK